MKGFVYIHTNRNNGKRYVGQTVRKPEVRWGKNGIHYKFGNKLFYDDIQKYGWDNFDHFVVEVPANLLDFMEQSLIRQYDTTNPEHGYNKSTGYGNTGCKRTEEYMNERYTPVIQTTKSGCFLNEYKSIKEASDSTGLPKGNICKCCKGIRNSAGGFVWRYKATNY